MSDQSKKRKALGKGLGALIPGAGSARSGGQRDYMFCPIEQIRPQKGQPRKRVDDEAIGRMAESIIEQGVIQPIAVRRAQQAGEFEIIAGERRWRAAQVAGLKEVPVVVKEASTIEAFEMALVENIQREDLNPIEEAEAYKRLMEERGYSQTEIASRVGRDRSTVANSLRLLRLPPKVREMVENGVLSEGHARAVLQAGSQDKMMFLAHKIAANAMSVREAERRSRLLASGKKGSSKGGRAASGSAEVAALVQRLQRVLGARVKLVDRKGKGRVEIHYTSYAELDRILDKIIK